MMNPCIIVPVYNHVEAIPRVLAKLKVHGLPWLLINDGSSSVCSQVLADCARHESNWINLLTRHENGGKGAAVMDGFKETIRLGCTQAIQIDADGRHDFDNIPGFLEANRLNPNAMIPGNPLFDETVHGNRLCGRKIANLLIWISILSFAIADGMCDFRLYPLAAVEPLISKTHIAKRMVFDIGIVVNLYWQGAEVIKILTAVKYPCRVFHTSTLA
jgi:glycosyltransferase involved in cell wall biosynthesis